MTPQAAEPDVIRFFIGTQSLKFDNQVHQVEVDEENNTIHRDVFLHKEGEVWHISSSTTDPQIIATCYNKVTGNITQSHHIFHIYIHIYSIIHIYSHILCDITHDQ